MLYSAHKIYQSPQAFRDRHPDKRLVVTSCPGDPIHSGHIQCFQESSNSVCSNWQSFAVIVNGDSFLIRKKGYYFMTLQDRMEIISAIDGVDFVIGYESELDTVSEALEILRPEIFTKGGDRNSPENVPEYETCRKIGCEIKFGIGGFSKVSSSSALIERAVKEVLGRK